VKSSNSLPLRIGTRGSALALAQAHLALNQLKKTFPQDPVIQNAHLIPITTTGDRITDRPLSEVGGKGLFVKEIEQALLSHEIDLAVHSLKDMETTLPTGLIIGATLKREEARDTLINLKNYSLETLPSGSIIGTSSPRRTAIVLSLRPDLICVPLRGNVDSRLQKLQEGKMDAIILALAGLQRLGRQDEATYTFSPNEMIPAVGQGTLVLECRQEDQRTQNYISLLNHVPSELCSIAERAFLKGLNGNCKTPIGGYATLQEDGKICLEAFIASPQGKPLYRTTQVGEDASLLGLSTATQLNEIAGPHFWDFACTS